MLNKLLALMTTFSAVLTSNTQIANVTTLCQRHYNQPHAQTINSHHQLRCSSYTRIHITQIAISKTCKTTYGTNSQLLIKVLTCSWHFSIVYFLVTTDNISIGKVKDNYNSTSISCLVNWTVDMHTMSTKVFFSTAHNHLFGITSLSKDTHISHSATYATLQQT